jgi:CRP-like cAMP-binding protein
MPTERGRFGFLSTTPLLERVDDRILWALAWEGWNVEFGPNDVVVREDGSPHDAVPHDGPRPVVDGHAMRFYLIRRGEAVVSTHEPVEGSREGEEGIVYAPDGSRIAFDPITGGRILARLGEGDFFGESALLAPGQRSANVRAGRDGLEVVAFDAQSFHTRIAEHVLVFRMVRNDIAAGSAPDVARMGLFNEMPMRDMTAVLRDARQERHPLGEAIVTQGDPGDRFYVILDGEVNVEVDDEVVARLERGDYFGETALLLGIPRTATVRAATHCTVWSITRDAFDVVIRSHLLQHAHPEAPALAPVDGYRPTGTGASLAARLRRTG